jgi:nucleoside 2-deoxyribosyltransferase
LTYEQVYTYYDYVERQLPAWIRPIGPMRRKEKLKEVGVLGGAYDLDCTMTQRGIVARDYNDVRRSDVILANFLGVDRISIGSCFELAWAFALQKPVVLCMEEGSCHDHPFVREAGQFCVTSIDDAIDAVVSITSKGI